MKIGFTGVPPLKLISDYKGSYPDHEWVDLDVPVSGIAKRKSAVYLPDTTCSIIQTIIANILALKPGIIIAPTGPCKCDSMRFLIPLIKKILPGTQIIDCVNKDKKKFGNPVSVSSLPLRKKFELITDGVLNTAPDYVPESCKPVAGFWGVPPYDFSVLDLFPDKTHVYGWTRCMENKTPHNPELELFVDDNVPVVFFSQSFCQKNILAKELARIHKGLYVEIDGLMDSSTKAKITAFLELRNCF
ncbi:MAG: hypothetical protein JXA66_03475 [Oligoflexia bacterium]|nr:hypothetical protein [Oligoflexia bacterium]